MDKTFVLLIALGSAAATDWIRDEHRACPDGYFYAGESSVSKNTSTRSIYWEEGERSPIYSCYKFIKKQQDFVSASLECNDGFGQLLSINDSAEEEILTSELFIKQFITEMSEELHVTGETGDVLTSGIELEQGNWTWSGAAEPIEEEIVSEIEIFETNGTASVQCLAVRWGNVNGSQALSYVSVPCTQNINISICEVKVYTQTWYGWMYTNWMQILFFFTVTLLLVSSCCMFQSLFFRNNKINRRGGGVATQRTPPPYTASPNYNATYPATNNGNGSNRYVDMGRDILAKVTFFKPREPEKVDLSRA